MTMVKKKIIIHDDEFRVIGGVRKKPEKTTPRWVWWFAIVATLVALGAVLSLIHTRREKEATSGVFEQNAKPIAKQTIPFILGSLVDSTAGPYVEVVDTLLNDVQLSIYIPQNTSPILYVGNPSPSVRKGILAFQAADIRADNRKILGAFVLAGEPLAWGLSKKGFCAIIDGKVTVGVSENSPLFEEATEKGGYFFRQYPLVNNGVLCESELKGKTMRKAICDRGGQIFVVVSETDESMHDFAQVLVDLGVDNAVYLVGSHHSFGWWRTTPKTAPAFFGEDVHYKEYRNESYIVWM